MDLAEIDEIVEKYRYEDCWLVGMLQDIQQKANYLSQEYLEYLAERLGIPESRVYGVATFYRSFSLEPQGKHMVQVCLGTACHVRGGQHVLASCEKKLGIRAGETSEDLEYTLHRVNCLGACALGPILVVDGEYHGQVNPRKASAILDRGLGPISGE